MLYLGIDLGGTNIAAGIVNENGKLLIKDSAPTLAQRDACEIADDMSSLCLRLIKEYGCTIDDIKAVGVGCPGAVDNKNGAVIHATNLNMHHAPIRELIQKNIKKPVTIENDGNAAAYGEYIVNGNNSDSFIFITLGTGVGGGIILNKKIYRGFNGIGGELGHITVNSNGIKCNCGNCGCWEKYASVTALISQTKEAMEKYPESAMVNWVKNRKKVSGRTSFDCAKQGDTAAQEVVKRYIQYISDGIVSIMNIFQPEKISIGGGISKEGDYLLKPLEEITRKNEFNQYVKRTKIEIATLFNDAGIIGAAMAAKSDLI